MEAVRRLALIGCGLMGGSFALALRQSGLVRHIAGWSRSAQTVARAVELGVINEGCSSAQEAVRHADLVLLAVPVTATQVTLQLLAPALQAEALVMDVGSTKRDVVAAAHAALGARVAAFLPAHPIAGKEHGGIEHAEARLYQDRLCILTPLDGQAPELTARGQALWEAVGCRVLRMTPAEHDQTYAAVSHLPHLLAFAYVQGITTQEQAARHLALAGPGFRDFTRIAAGTSGIWRDIFSANRDEVLGQLAHFEAVLARWRAALEANDSAALTNLIDAASLVRSAWRLNGAAAAEDDPA